MLALKSHNDLQRLVDEGLGESALLDYKASPSLARQDMQVNELCKDVSAFANSAGGQIIYGIEEGEDGPKRVDEGVSDPKITCEWIEQIILSRIQPRIRNFTVDRILLNNGNFAYIISIEATSTGAHQAPDKKYYRRFNLTSVPMEDYEIRGVNARSTSPSLDLSFRFGDGRRATTVVLPQEHDESSPMGLEPTITNSSPSPAYYVVVTIYLDRRVRIAARKDWGAGDIEQAPNGVQCHTLPKLLGLPGTFPIFKERPLPLGEFDIAFPAEYFRRGDEDFVFGYAIQSPGFELTRFGDLTFVGGNIRIELPK